MRLTMHNVGFGDCFELEENNHRLLVDCGSKNELLPNPANGTFFRFVDNLFFDFHFEDEETNEIFLRDALLTHFHADHYKGFIRIAKNFKKDSKLKRFDRFYVPYIAFNDKDKYCFIFVKMAVYLYCFLKKHRSNSRFFLYGHIKTLRHSVNDLKNIICLKTGDQFQIGSTKFNVLWPYFPKGTHMRAIENLLAKIDEELKDDKVLEDLNKKIFYNLKKFYDLISNNSERNRGIGNDKDDSTLIEEILKSQRQALIALSKKRRENKGKQITGIDKLKLLFDEGMNATSIVFCDDNHKLLMTGDVTKNVIDKHLFKGQWEYIKNYCIKFQFIKAPHHGTDTYYTINLPSACHILISTGEFKNYGKISTGYFNHECVYGTRICTSGKNWCQIISDKKKQCKLAICETRVFRHNI